MNAPKLHKLLFASLVTLLLLVCGVISVVLVQTYREYNYFKQREHKYRNTLTAAKTEITSREEYLDRLFDDPEFFERVVRDRLGYSKSNELIFKFDKTKDDEITH